MTVGEMTVGEQTVGEQTVPDALIGCWRRNWIRFGDGGERETDTTVVWLQTASGMGDLRIDPRQAPAKNDSSCGVTIVDETTTPHMTADWFDGESGFSQQEQSRFPEPGWLSWQSETVMHELAPSGAYVEEWVRLPESAGLIEHYVAIDSPTRTNLYVAGQHLMCAVERGADTPIHEYSYGMRTGEIADPIIITLSTMADRIGRPMDMDYDWKLVSQRTIE